MHTVIFTGLLKGITFFQGLFTSNSYQRTKELRTTKSSHHSNELLVIFHLFQGPSIFDMLNFCKVRPKTSYKWTYNSYEWIWMALFRWVTGDITPPPKWSYNLIYYEFLGRPCGGRVLSSSFGIFLFGPPKQPWKTKVFRPKKKITGYHLYNSTTRTHERKVGLLMVGGASIIFDHISLEAASFCMFSRRMIPVSMSLGFFFVTDPWEKCSI